MGRGKHGHVRPSPSDAAYTPNAFRAVATLLPAMIALNAALALLAMSKSPPSIAFRLCQYPLTEHKRTQHLRRSPPTMPQQLMHNRFTTPAGGAQRSPQFPTGEAEVRSAGV